jgi:26S proteasome regulatory subunit N12
MPVSGLGEMEEKLHDIRQTFQKFKAAYATNSFDTCSNLLSQLKVMILIFVLVLVFYYYSPS